MKEINFTEELRRIGKPELSHGYELSESEKYFIKYTKDFFTCNVQNLFTIEMLGGLSNPDCYRVVKDFNDFMQKHLENKSIKEQQDLLRSMWGKHFLWDNKFTRGIVVKLVEPDDMNDFTFQILIECSRECTGFKYSKIVISDSYSNNSAREVFMGCLRS